MKQAVFTKYGLTIDHQKATFTKCRSSQGKNYGGPLGPFGRIAKRTKVELRIQSCVTSLRPTWVYFVTQIVRPHTCSPLYPRKMKLRVPLHPAHVLPLLVALFASPVRSITPPRSPSLHQGGTTDDLITYYFKLMPVTNISR